MRQPALRDAVFGAARPDYHLWLSKHWLNIIYFSVLFLLIAVDTVGVTTKGAQRWLYIGPFSLQPSELAKLAVIMVCAGELGKRLKKHLRPALFDYPGNKTMVMALIYGALVLKQPDMGTAAIVVALSVGMYILAGLPLRMLLLLMSGGFVGVVGLLPLRRTACKGFWCGMTRGATLPTQATKWCSR